MTAPNAAPPAAAPRLAPTFTPSLAFSPRVIPAAVPPLMKAPITPPLMAQSPQYLGWPRFAHPAIAVASTASRLFGIRSLYVGLVGIVPPLRCPSGFCHTAGNKKASGP